MFVMDQQAKKINDPISVDEAAEILAISTTHVTRLLREGQLLGRKMSPRLWIVSAKSVKHFAKNRPKLGRPPLS